MVKEVVVMVPVFHVVILVIRPPATNEEDMPEIVDDDGGVAPVEETKVEEVDVILLLSQIVELGLLEVELNKVVLVSVPEYGEAVLVRDVNLPVACMLVALDWYLALPEYEVVCVETG